MRWQNYYTDNVLTGIATENVRGYTDDLEMASEKAAFVVTYGADCDGALKLTRHPVFPMLRKRPNDTHASFQCDIPYEAVPVLLFNGETATETAVRFVIDGILHIYSSVNTGSGTVEIVRDFYPASRDAAGIERITVKNTSAKTCFVSTNAQKTVRADSAYGCMGICICEVVCNFPAAVLMPGEYVTGAVTYHGRLANETLPMLDANAEFSARRERVRSLCEQMRLETGNDALDLMFRFAKLRAGESVFKTKAGYLHSPGGFSYFAAIWCNDQVEYSGPYFAYTGDSRLISAAENAYRLFEPFMDDSYRRIPSSVIAEGVDYWDGAGDRGDAAMFLYGASHFALTCGNKAMALRLWKSIKWAAEYCERQKTEQGVIASDSDELEGRFPSGTANLSTSCLCYAGLRAAAVLARELDDPDADVYRQRQIQLKEAIENYFGADIHSHRSYKYYDGCDILRSWMCLPPCFGIFDRARGTIDALTDPRLMTVDGLLTAEGCPTVWDRSTLYGLRGIFAAAAHLPESYRKVACGQLDNYVNNRLYGERVPYAVEAYPEGGRRHLSGESALFCKIILEGILGITPTGLHSFTFTTALPKTFDHLYLYGIKMHGASVDIKLERDGIWAVYTDGRLYCEGAGQCTVAVKIDAVRRGR